MSVFVDAAGPLVEEDPDGCPLCGTSLLGEPIPEGSRQHYGQATHFRREIGIQTNAYDGMLYFVCPDCHGAWPRFVSRQPSEDRLVVESAAAVEAHRAQVALLTPRAGVEQTMRERADDIAFALGLHDFQWTGWAFDDKTGAHLYLMVRIGASANMTEAQALVRDMTGLPVVLVGAEAPMVQFLTDVREPETSS